MKVLFWVSEAQSGIILLGKTCLRGEFPCYIGISPKFSFGALILKDRPYFALSGILNKKYRGKKKEE